MKHENKEPIDNDELKQYLESRIDRLESQIKNGDTLVRQYVDTQIKGALDVVDQLRESLTTSIEIAVTRALAPMIADVAKIVERSANTANELEDSKNKQDKLEEQFSLLKQQTTVEQEARKQESEKIHTILMGDGTGLYTGLAGGQSRIESLIVKQIKTADERYEKQQKINAQVKSNTQIVEFYKRINWKFVARWGVIASGLSGGGLYAVLEALNII